jgi:hypothetical protein
MAICSFFCRVVAAPMTALFVIAVYRLIRAVFNWMYGNERSGTVPRRNQGD